MDLTAEPIRSYQQQLNGSISEEATYCSEASCREFKLRDFEKTIGNYFVFMLFNASDCNDFHT